jgi:hypothetical protein
VPVDTEDSGDQFAPKPVHHRHHDDQRGNAEHDANEGKPGNHRNERFLPPRAQVAPGDHALEGRERPGGGGSNCGVWFGHRRFLCPMLDLAGLREAVDGSLNRKRFALAGCPDLDFDIAIGDSPRGPRSPDTAGRSGPAVANLAPARSSVSS